MVMGRPRQNPNVVHYCTPFRVAKAAAARKKAKGGKVSMGLLVPPRVYDQVRAEAIRTGRSMSAVAFQCLEAGLALSGDEA